MRRAAAACALFAIACGERPPPGAPNRLEVFVQPFLSHAPLHMAQSEGYFAEQGIEVRFRRMSDASNAIPLLLDGTLDVIAGGPGAGILNAMARGLPVRAVADKGYMRPGGCSRAGIVVRKALMDPAGGLPRIRRISIDKQPHQWYLAERMLRSRGLSLDQLEVLHVPHLPEMQALADGTIDAAVVGEPYLAMDVDAGHVVQWIRQEDVVPGLQFSFIFFGPDLLNGDPDVGRRFLVAYLKGVRLFEEGKTPGNLELLERLLGEGPELLRRTCWPAFHLDGRVDLQGILDFQTWALEEGLVETPAPVDAFWDGRFLEAANRTLAEEGVR